MSKGASALWKARHNLWLQYVRNTVRTVEAGRSIPLGPSRQALEAPRVLRRKRPPKSVLLCSPHPDDESLTGALPLRLRLEAGMRVVNCAITLGSDTRQRGRRLAELESACRVLGFELVVPGQSMGFDRVNAANRQEHPDEWMAKVEALGEVFEREKPDVVFAPHARDFNTTHIGTHMLVVDALGAYLERHGSKLFPLIETEFWAELTQPNLMVGVSAEALAVLLMAAAEHGAEMRRNPYCLLQPHRLMNNVRRGSEVVGRQGRPAKRYPFAELYRAVFLKGAKIVAPKPVTLMLDPGKKADLSGIVGKFLPEEA